MSMDCFGGNIDEMVSTTSRSRGHHQQLHGSRPPPLRVNNNNNSKIMKPRPNQKQQHHHRHRSPKIIYIKSPKIIHVKPEEFMSLVQRLTGRNQQATIVSSYDDHSSSSSSPSKVDKMTSTDQRSSKDRYDITHDDHEVDFGGRHEALPVISSLAPPPGSTCPCPAACPNFCIHVYAADWQGLRDGAS